MTTRATERLVVDASVAVKWHLTDEDDAPQALDVLRAYTTGRLALIAPEHIRYEVPSAIRVATLRQRLTTLQGELAIQEFLGFRIPTVNDDDLVLAAYAAAHRYACAFYDGLYVALAERLPLPLLTADRKLYNRIRHLPGVLWLTTGARIELRFHKLKSLLRCANPTPAALSVIYRQGRSWGRRLSLPSSACSHRRRRPPPFSDLRPRCRS